MLRDSFLSEGLRSEVWKTMSRRPRVGYTLDTGTVKSLSEEEKAAILRAADELIGTGGRSMLTKILKGSRDKKILEHGLDRCPAYGFYRSMTLEEISHRVDWMIKKDYLWIDYEGRLPMLVFSEKGWEMERDTYAEELYKNMCQDVEEGQFRTIHEMKNVNRLVVFDVLEKIRAGMDEAFLPMLAEWKEMEVRKVRDRIGNVVKTIESRECSPVFSWTKAQKGDAPRLSLLVDRTVREIYPNYYSKDIVDFFCFLHGGERMKAEIEAGLVWQLFCDGRLAGTGSRNGNHITGVYVLPGEQGRGLGSYIMEKLEQEIRKKSDRAILDASAPAESFYEHRGYRVVERKTLSMGNAELTYPVMEKIF